MHTESVFRQKSAMDIVDAQLHLSLSPGADGIIAAMDALGIAGVVLDEVWGRNEKDHATPCVEFSDGAYRPLSPGAQVAALRYPDRFPSCNASPAAIRSWPR